MKSKLNDFEFFFFVTISSRAVCRISTTPCAESTYHRLEMRNVARFFLHYHGGTQGTSLLLRSSDRQLRSNTKSKHIVHVAQHFMRGETSKQSPISYCIINIICGFTNENR